MRRLCVILVYVLVALWLPVTMHCRIEAVTGWDIFACQNHSADHSNPDHSQPAAGHEESDCEGDGCGVIESGHYQIEPGPGLLHPPVMTLVYVVPLIDEAEIPAEFVQPASWIPPDQVAAWFFIQKVAGSPRAPAFHS